MTPTPHDALFKSMFSNPERAMGLAASLFPERVLRHIELASARLAPGSFVDDELAQKHSDLLFQANVAGKEGFVYLLFEHQSEPDLLMPWRLLVYMIRIWERWFSEHPGVRTLPVLLPIVLSHGANGWRSTTRFAGLHELSSEVLEDLGSLLLDFRLTLDDLTDVSDEEIRKRIVDALGRLVLLVLKHARTTDDLITKLHEWADLFDRVSRAPHGIEALVRVIRYLFVVGDVPEAEVPNLVASMKVEEDVREVIMTTAEQLIAKGEERGLQKGLQKGLDGQRRLLARQLEARFGVLPPPFASRVQAVPAEELERLGILLLTARSLEELFP